jgi:hypothetical protein
MVKPGFPSNTVTDQAHELQYQFATPSLSRERKARFAMRQFTPFVVVVARS